MIGKNYDMGIGEPAGYVPITNQQRTDWNNFLDSKQSLPVYTKSNPDFSLTSKQLPFIQYEQNQLRNGDTFGNLNPVATAYIRSGLTDAYLNKPVSNMPGYYPQHKDFGTDIEGYYNSKVGLAPTTTAPEIIAKNPTSVAPLVTSENKPPIPTGSIPRPNYIDSGSRINYLQQWAKKYGDLQGRGDTVMKVNEVPRTGSGTSEQLATKFGKQYGIDPALLYTSAMEEGMSGLYKNINGTDTKGRKPGEYGYQDYYDDKEFPINGGQSFGFQTFTERFPDLVKGGYLPKEFASQFRGSKASSEDDNPLHDANNFKTADAALQAKAAMMKYGQDYVKRQASQNNIQLSPKQLEFFTLAWFNGGEGAVKKRLPEYKSKGYLNNDDFINQRPPEEKGKPSNLDVYGHIVGRMKMRDNLKKEGYFE